MMFSVSLMSADTFCMAYVRYTPIVGVGKERQTRKKWSMMITE